MRELLVTLLTTLTVAFVIFLGFSYFLFLTIQNKVLFNTGAIALLTTALLSVFFLRYINSRKKGCNRRVAIISTLKPLIIFIVIVLLLLGLLYIILTLSLL